MTTTITIKKINEHHYVRTVKFDLSVTQQTIIIDEANETIKLKTIGTFGGKVYHESEEEYKFNELAMDEVYEFINDMDETAE